MRELLTRSAGELASEVAKGAVGAEELTRASLDAIASRDGRLGAFLTVQADAALAAARAVDDKRRRGERLGPLAGVPIGIKDAILVEGAPATAASRVLTRRGGADPNEGFCAPYEATSVARLRAADAVLVGKTNMDELAMGSSTENSGFFPTKNPHDEARIPGGSSGGSAVAVAANMTTLSLGSDTGGSIRQPASLCGVVGVKPTYGRVSRYGLIAFASSLDQIGVFSRDTRGAALALGVIAGHDPADATSVARDVPGWARSCEESVAGLRVGVPSEYFADGVEPAVRARVEAAIAALGEEGATVVPVSLPATRFAVATYYILATAEASSNLSRFDGVRFGLRVEKPGDSLETMYERTRGAGFGAEVKRRIVLGTFVLSSGYYDAYYLRAQRARTVIRRDFDRVFEAVDVLATPTSPTVAFKLGERTADPLSMYLADVCTLPASLAGLPAISVPCGAAEPPGGGPPLPVGLQLIAPAWQEARLFTAAAAVERSLS
ncbi:MAG: Asp-tRNA(Asn)/Glu-tRNA(Gln) amidotransferase subunit GatA [Myxococcales bacterium]|nr:Asp-tRNA(Asn)/Glu-tRNA(Gln) amidotransferase subunit GatA [Myxococcales bacterium]